MRRLLARLCSMIGSFGLREWGVVLTLMLITGAIWVFAEIADEVLEGESVSMDEKILLLMRSSADPGDPLGPGWVEEMARDFTALGSTALLTLLTLAVAGLLAIEGKKRGLALLVLAIGSGTAMVYLLKMGFSRPRPELVPHVAEVYTSSFPSGHSMMAAMVFLTLGVMLARMHASKRAKVYFLSLAILLALVVGVSRVYLGVHWPTDVLAGWTLGGAWALLWSLVTFFLQRKGAVEQPSGDEEEPIEAA